MGGSWNLKRAGKAFVTGGYSEIGAAAGVDFANVSPSPSLHEKKKKESKLTYSKDQTPSKEAQRRMKIARRSLSGETGLITSSLLSGYKKPAI